MEKIVQAQLDAYNAHDIDRFCACYHPEVKVVRFISQVTTVKSVAELKDVYKKLFVDNPRIRAELKSRIILEDVIIDEEFVTGLQRAPQGLHTIAVYGFREGLIDRVWFP